jgi:hypothetical protein
MRARNATSPSIASVPLAALTSPSVRHGLRRCGRLLRWRPALPLLLLLVWAAAPEADAQEVREGRVERPHYQIPRTTSEIVVDGHLDEAAWEDALVITLDYEVMPGENVPPPVATECRLTYDDRHLYFGCVAHDPDPGAIRAHLTDRDRAFNDDFVGVFLDTFDDERRAYELFVNPLGVQMDLIRNDTGSGPEEDASWDAIWASAGRITEEGYVVETAIPFTSLRFQRSDGEQTWGLFLFRAYPRQHRHQIANVPFDRNLNCFLCQTAKVTGFAGVEPGRNLEVTPTLTAQRTDRRPDFPQGSLESGSVDGDLGVTAMWGVTPNLTLGATLNPDFSQVEADAAQLDVNTQFALFFPEKRPFFLEGADYFSTPLQTVHSRNVADPSWGLRLTGKEGHHAVGAFVVEDERTNLLIPGREGSVLTSLAERNLSSVARYRRDVGETSTLGFLYAGRQGSSYSNHLGGLDGQYRLTDQDLVRGQLLWSTTEYPEALALAHGQPLGSFSDHALQLRYSHSSREWGWSVLYEDVGEDFRADLGFMPQVDYRSLRGRVSRNWWGEPGAAISTFNVGTEWNRTEDQRGDLLNRTGTAWLNAQGPYQSFLNLNVTHRQQAFSGRRFDTTFGNFFLQAQPSGKLSLGISGRVGDGIDFTHARQAQVLTLRPNVAYNLGRHLRLSLSHVFERLDVEGGRLFTANLSDFRAVYQINVRTFVRLITQYRHFERDIDLWAAPVTPSSDSLFTQLLFSYKINPQTVLFLGYSDNHRGDDQLSLTQSDRTLFFKVGYAWLM